MEERELTEKIIGCAMKVHSGLGPGFLESVYAKALAYELRKAGLKVECAPILQWIFLAEFIYSHYGRENDEPNPAAPAGTVPKGDDRV
jgi:GxxExxY protein